MKLKFNILFLFSSLIISSQAQELKTAIQQGHRDEIRELILSPDEKLLLSVGNDQLVIWDLSTGMQLASKTFPMENGKSLFVDKRSVRRLGKSNLVDYEILNDKFTIVRSSSDSAAQHGNQLNDTLYEFIGPKIQMQIRGEVRAVRTTDNFDQPFTYVNVPPAGKYIFATSTDGKVYVYSRTDLKLVAKLSGHRSGLNVVSINKNADLLYSAGKDRSIVEWDLRTFSMKRRFRGYSYRITSAVFHPNGNEIIFGNELGDVKSLPLNQSLPLVKNINTGLHPVVQLKFIISRTDTSLYAGSLNNYFHQVDPGNLEIVDRHRYIRQSGKSLKRELLHKIFNLYFPPAYQHFMLVPSADGKKIAVAGRGAEARRIQVKIFNLENGKLRKLGYEALDVIDIVWTGTDELIVLRKTPPLTGIFNYTFEDAFLEQVIIRKNRIYSKKRNINPSIFHRLLQTPEKTLLVSDFMVQEYDAANDTLQFIAFTQNKITAADFIDGKLLLSDDKHQVIFYNSLPRITDKPVVLGNHDGQVNYFSMHPSKPMLITCSDDASMKIWNTEEQKLIATIIPVGKNDYAIQLGTGEYQISKSAYKLFGFRYEDKFVYPDQFDLRFNKPHKVLASFGLIDTLTLKSLEIAYHKRLKKLGFTEKDFENTYSLPTTSLELISQDEEKAVLKLSAQDEHFLIDRFNLFVNDVPVFGTKGFSIKDKNVKFFSREFEVNLLDGMNRIDFSVINSTGTESVRNSVVLQAKNVTPPKYYVVAFGCSEYKDSRFNLKYPAKDATDFVSLITSFEKEGKEVKSQLYTNSQVTIENVREAKKFLERANSNDIVLVLVAGHGVLDAEFNYYFASYDLDFNDPSKRGIEYSLLEALLDGIKPLRKLLFMDTCHSGEVEKDEVELATNTETTDGEIKFRNSGAGIREKKGAGLVVTSGFVKELFSDVRKGNGSTVIASSGGAEYSVEGDKWKNGLFTYCVMSGIKNKKGDLNKDGMLKVSELQKYVQEMVGKLSQGKQIPNSRTENTILDFALF